MTSMEPSDQNDTYGDYSIDAEDQPQDTGDSLADSDRGLVDPMDEGYSPPEKWSAAEGFGNTPYEEATGETLDQRIEQEIPEEDPYEAAEREEEDLDDGEVGTDRSGRLVAPDQGIGEDVDKELIATDVGIDGAGAGAEEAAMHEVEDI